MKENGILFLKEKDFVATVFYVERCEEVYSLNSELNKLAKRHFLSLSEYRKLVRKQLDFKNKIPIYTHVTIQVNGIFCIVIPFKLPMIQYSIAANSRSGSADNFKIISKVCAKECTASPERTIVALLFPGATADSPSAKTTAAILPTKALAVTENILPDRNNIANAAPALAPEHTPIISGDANGL